MGSREDYLKKLILSQCDNIKDFAKSVQIPYTTLLGMLNNGVGGSSVDNVIKVCQGLNITIEDLQSSGNIIDPWVLRLRGFIDRSGKTLEEIAERSGVELSMVQNIVENGFDPPVEDISAIMESIGHTIDDLDGPEMESFPEHALDVARMYLRECDEIKNAIRRVLRLPELEAEKQ